MRHPTTARKLLGHEVRSKDLSPRLKLATRLYATGVARTKREAARMAGMAPSTFYLISTTEPKVSDLIAQIDREIEEERIDTGKLLERLGRRAVRNIAHFMESDTVKDEIRLKAAQDLADRSPETSKVLKVDARISTPISETQFEAMRLAMLESAALRAKFAEAAEGNFVTAGDAQTSRGLELVKDNAPLALPASVSPDEEDS